MQRCEFCGLDFKPAKPTRRYCSRSCKSRAQHRPKLAGTFYDRNADRIKAERKQRYATDPEYRAKVLARVRAYKHVPVRPCERCGEPNTDRHHEDYGRPLDVRFLCRKCHITEHVEQLGSWGSGLTQRA